MADKKKAKKDYKALGAGELSGELASLLSKRVLLQMQHNTRKIENPMELRALRHDIARVKTQLQLKEKAK